MITGFVAMMMVVIEYINILPIRNLAKRLAWRTLETVYVDGTTPGCPGAFAVVLL